MQAVPSVDEEKPYGACILGLSQQGTFSGSRWVTGGKMEQGMGFKAKNIFPQADTELYLELRGSYGEFTFPNTAGNFSSYREVPSQLPVVAYTLSQGQEKNFVTWEDAKARGCSEFCVRVVVLPRSTKSIFLQLGVAPFSMGHLKQHFSEMMDAAYFPNTMVRCTRTRVKLPPSMGGGSSMLIKEAMLIMEDTEGYGLGAMPFYCGTDFDPMAVEAPMPSYEAIKEGVFTHMRAGALPRAVGAAHMPAALALALKADKDPSNFMGPVASPWPAFNDNRGEDNGSQGRYHFGWLALAAVQQPGRLKWQI